MQKNVLAASPDAVVRIYAVYFEIVASDEGARRRVKPDEVFTDPRVRVFWDDKKVLGRWYDEHVTRLGKREGRNDRIEWDTYILYDEDAKWGERSNFHSWGRPLNQERQRLLRAVESLSKP